MAWSPFKSSKSRLQDQIEALDKQIVELRALGHAAVLAEDEAAMGDLGARRLALEARRQFVADALAQEERRISDAIAESAEAQRRADIRQRKHLTTVAKDEARRASDAVYRAASAITRYETAITNVVTGLPPALRQDFALLASPTRRVALLDLLIDEALRDNGITNRPRPAARMQFEDRRTGKVTPWQQIVETQMMLLRKRLDPSETQSVPAQHPLQAPPEAVQAQEPPHPIADPPAPFSPHAAPPQRFAPLKGEVVDMRGGNDLVPEGGVKRFDQHTGEYVIDYPKPEVAQPPKSLRLPTRKRSA